MKKVLLTSNLYLPNIGGIENSLHHLALCGLKKREDIRIITSNIIDGGEYLKSGDTIEDGINISRYKVNKDGVKLTKGIVHISSAIRTYFKYRDNKTIVIARYHWSVIFCFLSGYKNIRYLVPGVVKNQNKKSNLKKNNLISFTIDSFIQRLALRAYPNRILFQTMMLHAKCSIAS